MPIPPGNPIDEPEPDPPSYLEWSLQELLPKAREALGLLRDEAEWGARVGMGDEDEVARCADVLDEALNRLERFL